MDRRHSPMSIASTAHAIRNMDSRIRYLLYVNWALKRKRRMSGSRSRQLGQSWPSLVSLNTYRGPSCRSLPPNSRFWTGKLKSPVHDIIHPTMHICSHALPWRPFMQAPVQQLREDWFDRGGLSGEQPEHIRPKQPGIDGTMTTVGDPADGTVGVIMRCAVSRVDQRDEFVRQSVHVAVQLFARVF